MAAALRGRAPVAAPAVTRPVRQATKRVRPGAQPLAPPRKRRFPVWALVLGALGVLLACGAVLVLGGVAVQRSQRAAQQAEASATANAKKTAIAHDEAMATAEALTATADARERAAATSTARVLQATAHAEATATAYAQATAHAEATATAYAQATATAEARLYAPLQEVSVWSSVIFDDFSVEGNGWHTGDYSDALVVGGNRSISDGVYRWQAEAGDDFVWWSVPDTDSISDCYVAADARLVSGVPDAQYGLIFRRVDSKNYYLFLVRDDGYFELVGVFEGKWTFLIEWTKVVAIRSGEVNRLEIVAKGDKFAFYINGEHVGEYSDSQLASGKPAVVVGLTEAGDTLIVEFDNFELRVP